MPTFYPPLAHTSEVIVTDSTSTPYARLTFLVDLGQDEGVDGVYQLWTDLPDLDEHGKPLYAEGEWHEITFTTLPAPAAERDTSSSTAFQLPAILSTLQLGKALHAIIHIPARPASYSYTLRQVKGSGEIIWLGGEGSNGTVHVKTGDAGRDLVIESGVWDELALAKGRKIDWRGIAVEVNEGASPSAPGIIQLPVPETTKASLIVAVGINPLDNLAFAQLSATAEISTPPSTCSALAVCSPSGSPTTVNANSLLPFASEQSVFARNSGGSIVDAVSQAVSGQAGSAFKVIHTSASSVLLASTNSDRSSTHTILLLSYHPESTSTVIPIAKCIDAAGPVFLQNSTGRTIGVTTSNMNIGLAAGFVAEELRCTEMTELRDAGEVAPIWICAPAATSMEGGEEEIGDIVMDGKVQGEDGNVPDETNVISNDTSGLPADSSQEQPETPIQPGDDTEYEAEDEDDSPRTTAVKAVAKNEAFWLFKMIDSFFYRLWTLLFGPLQSTESKQKQQNATQSTAIGEGEIPSSDSIAVDSMETPANERTPLLATPGLSRSTSSTIGSLLASPESTLTIKASQALDNIEYTKKRLSRTDDTSDSEPTDSENGLTPFKNQFIPTSMRGTVKIRSYAHFKFACPPPFTFYVKQSEGWAEQLKFSFKARGEGVWREDEVDVKEEQGGAVEVVIGSKATEMGAEWDVQVERL